MSVLLILVALSLVSQVGAADLNSTDDVSLNEETSQIAAATHTPKNYTDLKSAVETASDGDTIELNGTYTFVDAITVSKKLTFVGVGDGANLKYDDFSINTSGFFNIQSSGVILNNLKFNGRSINVAGDNCSIVKCEFKSITSNSNGPLFITGANCNVTDSRFLQNKASAGAGAITVKGANTLISNCEFEDNEVKGDSGAGGALQLWANDCVVNNCIFTKNYCAGYGGAVVVYGNTNNVIRDSKFKANYVSGNQSGCLGGGAVFSAGALNIINCTFEENHADAAFGGAVILAENNRIEKSFFDKNMAKTGNDVYSNTTSYFVFNNIILDFMETQNQSVYGNDIYKLNNTFEVTKMDSTVKFITGMVFEYGSSGKIQVLVVGGKVEEKNIKVLGHNEAKIHFDGSVLTVSGLAVGKYTLRVTTTPDANHNPIDEELSITVKKATAVLKSSSRVVVYKRGDIWKLTFADSKTNKPISNMKVILKVFTGKKFKSVSLKTNSKGKVTLKTKKLSKGNHKVIITASHSGYNFNSVVTSLKVIKQKSISITAVVNNGKDGSRLTVSVKNKKTNKPLNGIKLKLLVKDGKKYKSFNLKTKTLKKLKGMASYGTNDLSIGKHKVKIVSDDIRYKGREDSQMIIKKSAKNAKNGIWTRIK